MHEVGAVKALVGLVELEALAVSSNRTCSTTERWEAKSPTPAELLRDEAACSCPSVELASEGS